MTSTEFNNKYKKYLEEGHYGLAINEPRLTKELDEMFQDFIKFDGFSYSQIKVKFGHGRFYCKGLSDEIVRNVELLITITCNPPKQLVP